MRSERRNSVPELRCGERSENRPRRASITATTHVDSENSRKSRCLPSSFAPTTTAGHSNNSNLQRRRKSSDRAPPFALFHSNGSVQTHEAGHSHHLSVEKRPGGRTTNTPMFWVPSFHRGSIPGPTSSPQSPEFSHGQRYRQNDSERQAAIPATTHLNLSPEQPETQQALGMPAERAPQRESENSCVDPPSSSDISTTSTAGKGPGALVFTASVHLPPKLRIPTTAALAMQSAPSRPPIPMFWVPSFRSPGMTTKLREKVGAMLSSPARSQEIAPLAAASMGPIRILVIDDCRMVRHVVTKMMSSMGCEIEEAVDGVQALQMLHQGREYDVILCDINMPNMSGDECITRIRKWESSPSGPSSHTVFALTGEENWANDATMWGALQMDGCIAKPVQRNKLQAVVTHATQFAVGERGKKRLLWAGA